MPLFYFYCSKCRTLYKRIFTAEEAKLEQRCKKDNEVLVRDHQGVSANIYEKIDNGLQAKPVVQLAGAPEMIQDRENLASKKKYDESL